MASMPYSMQQWIEHRMPALTHYRQAEALPIKLHRRRIYILPTRFGLGFAVLLLMMLIGALNYANNAALLLTCLLGAASISSMLLTFRTLDGLQLLRIQAGYAVAGQPIEVGFTFGATRIHYAVRLETADTGRTYAFRLETRRSQVDVNLLLSTQCRGWQALPRLRVWSTWPLGLFRAWSWLNPEHSVLIWPKAESTSPPPPGQTKNVQQSHLYHGDDLVALRDYRRGDPVRDIAWKASAKNHELQVKQFEEPLTQCYLELDWRQLTGLNAESRIARLAHWLDQAQSEEYSYSLWLPGEFIETGSGLSHYERCMNALAQLP